MESINETQKTDTEYRMYVLVLRQLNQMQKGIQAAHAVVEYINSNMEDIAVFGKEERQHSLVYTEQGRSLKQWMDVDKTLILLDGGTCPEMVDNIMALYECKVQYAKFVEPDLDNITTAIAFLASDKVWDKEKYPDHVGILNQKLNAEHLKSLGLSEDEISLREFIGSKHLAM